MCVGAKHDPYHIIMVPQSFGHQNCINQYIHPRILTSPFDCFLMSLKCAGRMVDDTDPDQTAVWSRAQLFKANDVVS